MLRLSDLKLHLNHTDSELNIAITNKLNLRSEELLGISIFKRSYDARKKTNIFLIYQLDLLLTASAESRVLKKYKEQFFLTLTPDSSYSFAAQARKNFPQADEYRPVIIGFGPCGILNLGLEILGVSGETVSLTLSQMFNMEKAVQELFLMENSGVRLKISDIADVRF